MLRLFLASWTAGQFANPPYHGSALIRAIGATSARSATLLSKRHLIRGRSTPDRETCEFHKSGLISHESDCLRPIDVINAGDRRHRILTNRPANPQT